jgi:hypothetical protein
MPEPFRKTIEEIINENPGEGLTLIVDELLSILDQPALPPDHPDAPAQRLEKSKAQAELDDVRTRHLTPLTERALTKLQELIDLPSLPHDSPNAAVLDELKRKARVTLLLWNAQYGHGGPYAGPSPTRDEKS